MQDVIPKTPANAVATVMITLRTMPHTDFDFVLMLFGYLIETQYFNKMRKDNVTMLKIK